MFVLQDMYVLEIVRPTYHEDATAFAAYLGVSAVSYSWPGTVVLQIT